MNKFILKNLLILLIKKKQILLWNIQQFSQTYLISQTTNMYNSMQRYK